MHRSVQTDFSLHLAFARSPAGTASQFPSPSIQNYCTTGAPKQLYSRTCMCMCVHVHVHVQTNDQSG